MSPSLTGVSAQLCSLTALVSEALPNSQSGWRVGQVLHAQVARQLAQNSFLLLAEGQRLVASSSQPLQEGQLLPLQVESRQDGQYVARVLTQLAGGQGEAQNLLAKLGLKDTPLNRMLLQVFGECGLPLKTELIQQAASLLQAMGSHEPAAMEAALLVLKNDLPPAPSILKALQAFLALPDQAGEGGQAQLARWLQQLGQALASLNAPVVNQDQAASLPPAGADARQAQQAPAGGQPAAPGQALAVNPLPAEMGGVTPELPHGGAGRSLRDLSSPATAAIPGWPEAEAPPGSAGPQTGEALPLRPATGKEPPVRPEVAFNRRGLVDLLQAILLHSDEDAEGITARLRQLVAAQMPQDHHVDAAARPLEHGPERSFSELLVRFSRLLKEARSTMPDRAAPEFERMLERGTSIERQLAGQQLLQGLQQGRAEPEYLYFHLPLISAGGQPENRGELAIIKDGPEGKRIDPDSFGLKLLLHTENLGTLLLEIRVRQKAVQASGKITTAKGAQALSQAWPQLQAGLGELGYALQPCAWQVGSFRPSLAPNPGGPAAGQDLRFLDATI